MIKNDILYNFVPKKKFKHRTALGTNLYKKNKIEICYSNIYKNALNDLKNKHTVFPLEENEIFNEFCKQINDVFLVELLCYSTKKNDVRNDTDCITCKPHRCVCKINEESDSKETNVNIYMNSRIVILSIGIWIALLIESFFVVMLFVDVIFFNFKNNDAYSLIFVLTFVFGIGYICCWFLDERKTLKKIGMKMSITLKIE